MLSHENQSHLAGAEHHDPPCCISHRGSSSAAVWVRANWPVHRRSSNIEARATSELAPPPGNLQGKHDQACASRTCTYMQCSAQRVMQSITNTGALRYHALACSASCPMNTVTTPLQPTDYPTPKHRLGAATQRLYPVTCTGVYTRAVRPHL